MVKVYILDIAPLFETPPHKRSGMTRVLKGSHSFTCTLTHSSALSEWAIPAVVSSPKWPILCWGGR